MLAKLFYADRAGRNGQGHEPLQGPIDVVEEFKQKIKALGLEYGPEKQILLGKDIADIVSPGQRMGEILKKAYSIQIEQNIKNKEELKKKIIKKLK
jgi:hypothetical protein